MAKQETTFIAVNFLTANFNRISACKVEMSRIVDWDIKQDLEIFIKPPTSEFTLTYEHQIKWDDVQNAQPFDKAWPQILDFLSPAHYFVGHHKEFHKKVMETCCKHYNLKSPKISNEWICTFQLSRSTWNFPNCKTPEIVGQRIGLDFHSHNSVSNLIAQILIKANCDGGSWQAGTSKLKGTRLKKDADELNAKGKPPVPDKDGNNIQNKERAGKGQENNTVWKPKNSDQRKRALMLRGLGGALGDENEITKAQRSARVEEDHTAWDGEDSIEEKRATKDRLKAALKDENKITQKEEKKYKTKPDGITYRGETKNGLKHGKGTLIFPNGDKYVGAFEVGKRHGQGIFTYSYSRIYTGDFKDDKFEGQGVQNFANGEKYEGSFLDGERHGLGIQTFASGNIYEGTFKDNKRDGEGIYTYSDGTVFNGQWEKGKPHGEGTYTFFDGSTRNGQWKPLPLNPRRSVDLKSTTTAQKAAKIKAQEEKTKRAEKQKTSTSELNQRSGVFKNQGEESLIYRAKRAAEQKAEEGADSKAYQWPTFRENQRAKRAKEEEKTRVERAQKAAVERVERTKKAEEERKRAEAEKVKKAEEERKRAEAAKAKRAEEERKNPNIKSVLFVIALFILILYFLS